MARILFVCGTNNHDPHLRKARATGGILNSLTLIPEYLAKQGHDVYVNSTYDKDEDVNGVHYVRSGKAIEKWDIVVFNRNVLPKDFIIYSKEIGAKIVWWLHDIVQLSYLQDDAFMMVDKVIALSQYCKQTYMDFYNIPEDKFVVIPNGVDKELFYPGDPEKRNHNLVIMASALVKGFMPIPCVFDNLKRHNYDIDFRIYSSQQLHGMNNSPEQQKFLERMDKEGAHVYHPVSQESLAILLRQAHCFLMPNSYPEICSNLLLQAKASGCPVITSDIGSAPEFIRNGIDSVYTTKYKPHDLNSWIVEYTNLVLDVYLNKEFHNKLSVNAVDNVPSWEDIGRKWNDEINQLVSNKLPNLEKV